MPYEFRLPDLGEGITDGGDATRFLSRVARFLEDPALLFIESI